MCEFTELTEDTPQNRLLQSGGCTVAPVATAALYDAESTARAEAWRHYYKLP